MPGKNFSYSDHEGVAATFVVNDTLGTDRTGKAYTVKPVLSGHPRGMAK